MLFTVTDPEPQETVLADGNYYHAPTFTSITPNPTGDDLERFTDRHTVTSKWLTLSGTRVLDWWDSGS